MAPSANRVGDLQDRIRHYRKLELSGSTKATRRAAWLSRWGLMLYREFIRDDVKVRAESLAYLMLFSILPLIAGSFFVFTVFTQFGMVQEAIGGFVNGMLETIPEGHREVVQEYVVRFKDAYLTAIAGKSGTLGIFALLFLFWVGLQTFTNIERTLNHIWSAERGRPIMEKVRNFIVVSVGAPFVLIASLSVPIILRKTPGVSELFVVFPILGGLMNFSITAALILATFTLLYKFVPVCNVRWKSAFVGGVFSTVLMQVANIGMNFYFRVGTNTAYGKAAVAPLIGFWIYLVWMIVILGAELSYLVQNERHYLNQAKPSPSILESETMLAILHLLRSSHRAGTGPVPLEKIYSFTKVDTFVLRKLLMHLESRNLIVRALPPGEERGAEAGYTLARDIGSMSVGTVLREFVLHHRADVPESPLRDFFDEKLEGWIKSLESRRFEEFNDA